MDIATSNLSDEQFARIGGLWIRYRDAFYEKGRIVDKWDPIMSDLSNASHLLRDTDAGPKTVSALKKMLAAGGVTGMISDMERLIQLDMLMRDTRAELLTEWDVDTSEIFHAPVKG